MLFLQLTGGQLVVINAKLVKKQRFHFTTLQGLDVDIITGLNGLIWVSPHVERMDDGTPIHQQQQQQGDQAVPELVDSAAAVAAAAAAAQGPSKEQREAVVRVAGAIRALAALMLQVYPGSIIEAFQVSSRGHVAVLDAVQTAEARDRVLYMQKGRGVCIRSYAACTTLWSPAVV